MDDFDSGRRQPFALDAAGDADARVGAAARRLRRVRLLRWHRNAVDGGSLAEEERAAVAREGEIAHAGAAAAATPTELARNAEAVITILTDAAAIDAVYAGASGLLAPDVRGKLFIEMSTVQPQTEVALAAKVRAKGAALVECPVGGSTGPARQGKLIGLMGGEPPDAARAKPILDQLCRRLEHCGPVGSGAVMKLTINMPLMIYWQALGEARGQLVGGASLRPVRSRAGGAGPARSVATIGGHQLGRAKRSLNCGDSGRA